MHALLNDVRTRRFWKHFSIKTFAAVGALSTVYQMLLAWGPNWGFFHGWPILLVLIAVPVAIGIIASWPRPISQSYEKPKTKISIVKGDILSGEEHLVIGMCDTFDTETRHGIIAKESLLGQLINRFYGDEVADLDSELAKSLNGAPVSHTLPASKAGKQQAYAIGTVASVKQAGRLLFFLAYCKMDEHNNARATVDYVWKSLLTLWEEVSKKANEKSVSIPVIGGGKARISQVLPAQDSIRLMILSFMFASRQEPVCTELKIVVSADAYDHLDRLELQAFLSSLRGS
jgi:hypothetical protein